MTKMSNLGGAIAFTSCWIALAVMVIAAASELTPWFYLMLFPLAGLAVLVLGDRDSVESPNSTLDDPETWKGIGDCGVLGDSGVDAANITANKQADAISDTTSTPISLTPTEVLQLKDELEQAKKERAQARISLIVKRANEPCTCEDYITFNCPRHGKASYEFMQIMTMGANDLEISAIHPSILDALKDENAKHIAAEKAVGVALQSLECITKLQSELFGFYIAQKVANDALTIIRALHLENKEEQNGTAAGQ
jgi:hypothetical protein